MNWKTTENGEAIRPADMDSTSSRAYVYLRRNIALVEATEDMPAHYQWEEMKLPKDAAEILIEHSGELKDLIEAVCELGEIISEGE